MMNFESGGFCDISEYKSGEKLRLPADKLHIDELYMLMLAMKQGTKKLAAKQPTRVYDHQIASNGICRVGLAFLDNDLQVQVNVQGTFGNGYWLDVRDRIIINKRPVIAAYLKGYEDGADGEWQTILDSLQVPELVQPA